MPLKTYIKLYTDFLQLEKGLSQNSIIAYTNDLKKLNNYLTLHHKEIDLQSIQIQHLQSFIAYLNQLGLSINSQARILSSLKNFFSYLVLEKHITSDPAQLLSPPKRPKHLPTTLTFQEIEDMVKAIDHSKKEGHRNRAIIEVLYACGLRVSELVELKLSNLFLEIGFLKVVGKGNKERMVPIAPEALKYLDFYLKQRAQQKNIDPKHEDIIFLNRRGKQLTRNMVFMIVRDLAKAANIHKKVSPHTFRHSFATHLIEGGADLKIVQDLLGHESITTTEIYIHLDMNFLKQTLSKFHPSHQ